MFVAGGVFFNCFACYAVRDLKLFLDDGDGDEASKQVSTSKSTSSLQENGKSATELEKMITSVN